jgi:hypothetical protein
MTTAQSTDPIPYGVHTSEPSPMGSVNAALIAAAPELLEALKALMGYANLGAYERAAVRQQAHAAIQKATGGQQ